MLRSNKHKLFITLAALIVFTVAVPFFFKRSPKSSAGVLQDTASAENVTSAAPLDEPVTSAVEPPANPDQQGKTGESIEIDEAGAQFEQPLWQDFPKIEEVREEVARDAHSTPQALLLFSLSLGERLDAAVGSKAKTDALYAELEKCFVGEEHHTLESVRSLCFLNARRLAENDPDLRQKFATQAALVPENVKVLNHLLLKKNEKK